MHGNSGIRENDANRLVARRQLQHLSENDMDICDVVVNYDRVVTRLAYLAQCRLGLSDRVHSDLKVLEYPGNHADGGFVGGNEETTEHAAIDVRTPAV